MEIALKGMFISAANSEVDYSSQEDFEEALFTQRLLPPVHHRDIASNREVMFKLREENGIAFPGDYLEKRRTFCIS